MSENVTNEAIVASSDATKETVMILSDNEKLEEVAGLKRRQFFRHAGLGAAGVLGGLAMTQPVEAQTTSISNVIYDKGGAVFNVKADTYGAKGDGSTDDTAAIRRAITAALNSGGGRCLFTTRCI